jgi:hypothetical protein
MTASDFDHEAVKAALRKDGCTITHDPDVLEVGEDKVYDDLGAERPIAAEKNGGKLPSRSKAFAAISTLVTFNKLSASFCSTSHWCDKSTRKERFS